MNVKKASLADPWSYIPICVFLYKDSTTIASQRDVGHFIECQSNPWLGFFEKLASVCFAVLGKTL